MRASRAIPILGLLLALGAIQMHAESLGEFAIPFDFTVGNKTLPAGDYSVRNVNSGSFAIRIQNRETYASAIAITNAVQNYSNRGYAKLVFHRYGNRHFLSQVWSGYRVGRQLPKRYQELSLVTSSSHRQVEILASNF